MADPNLLNDIIRVDVRLIDGVASAAGFNKPLFVAQFASSPSFPGRYKAYSGSAAIIDALLAADGFAAGSGPRPMAAAATEQNGPPVTVLIGRWDPGDATLADALTAIKAELDLDNVDGYVAHPDPLIANDGDLFDGVQWADGKFTLFCGQTKSAAVFNNTPGNLAEQVLALDTLNTTLLWHDAAAASKLGPAVLVSAVETFVVPDGATLDLRVDNGPTQSFAFTATAATTTGSNTETFAFTDGDTLSFAVDGGETQVVPFETLAASLLSGAVEPYNFANGDTLLVRVDGGAVQAVQIAGTAGAVTTFAEPFAFVAATITLSIDGGANQVFALSGVSAADVVSDLAALTGATAVDVAGTVVITSNRLGASSDVEIVAAAGNALAELGVIVGNNAGTGGAASIAFLDATSAAELRDQFNNDVTGATAGTFDLGVLITSDTIGKNSRLQVTGGLVNVQADFSTNEVSGSGDFNDASAASAAEVVLKIDTATYGVVPTVDAGAVVLTSSTRGSGSQVAILGGTAATTLGLTTSPAVVADFVNAATALASEIAVKIGATITGATASAVSSAVRVTSATNGATSRVQAIGGTMKTLLGFADSVLGVGVEEDYQMCRWIGARIAVDIDARAVLWDNVSPVGGYADRIDPLVSLRLRRTQFVNTIENRSGRVEFHDGALCNSTRRYIDERTTADLGHARLVEALKTVQDNAANQNTKTPIDNDGIEAYANAVKRVVNALDKAGHWVADFTPIDSSKANATGFNVPDVSELTDDNIADRELVGMVLILRLKGGFQRARVLFDLTRLLAG